MNNLYDCAIKLENQIRKKYTTVHSILSCLFICAYKELIFVCWSCNCLEFVNLIYSDVIYILFVLALILYFIENFCLSKNTFSPESFRFTNFENNFYLKCVCSYKRNVYEMHVEKNTLFQSQYQQFQRFWVSIMSVFTNSTIQISSVTVCLCLASNYFLSDLTIKIQIH